MDYKKAYNILFNAMTDAIEKSEVITQEMDEGISILKKAQQTTEEIFVSDV